MLEVFVVNQDVGLSKFRLHFVQGSCPDMVKVSSVKCMPSTVFTSFSVLASSTVMTPSLPITFMASAIKEPMVLSLFAEIVPTCSILLLSATSRLIFGT